MSKLKEIGEFKILETIQSLMPTELPKGLLGIGDDCAFVQTQGAILATTDTLVEGRHFRKDWGTPQELGWKLVAVSLSDIAAMGGTPTSLLLSLQLPEELELSWVTELYRGIYEICLKFHVSVSGGNISNASEISLTSTVLGELTSPSTSSTQVTPLLRSGAQVGDDIWVGSSIGNAFLGLQVFQGKISTESLGECAEKCRAAYLTPHPQIQLGQLLSSEQLAHSAIDLSDGLIQDASHVAKQSNVALVLDFEQIPIPSSLVQSNLDRSRAITGGGDYVLLFTSPQKCRARIEKITAIGTPVRIGEVVPASLGGPSVSFRFADGKLVDAPQFIEESGLLTGYDHYR